MSSAAGTPSHDIDDVRKVLTALAQCLQGVLAEEDVSPKDAKKFHETQLKCRNKLVAAITTLVEKKDAEVRAAAYRLIVSLRTFLGVIGQPSKRKVLPSTLSDLYTRILNACDDSEWDLYQSANFTVVPGGFDTSGRDLFVGYCADDFFVVVRLLANYATIKDSLLQNINESINKLLRKYSGSKTNVSDPKEVFLSTYTQEEVIAKKGFTKDEIERKVRLGEILYGHNSAGIDVYPKFQFRLSGGLRPFIEKMLAALGTYSTLRGKDSRFLQPWGIAYWVYMKWMEWDKPDDADPSSFVITAVENSRIPMENGLEEEVVSEMEGTLQKAIDKFWGLDDVEKTAVNTFEDLSMGARRRTFYRVVWSASHWCRFSQRNKQGDNGRFSLSRDQWAGTLYLTSEPIDAIRETLEHDLVIGLKDVANRSIVTVKWAFPKRTYLCVFREVFHNLTQNNKNYTKLSWKQAQTLGDMVFSSRVSGIAYRTWKAEGEDYALFGSGPSLPFGNGSQTTNYLVESPHLWLFLEDRQDPGAGGDPDSVYLGRYPDDVQLKK